MDFPWRVKQRQADAHLRRFADDCARYVITANVGFDCQMDATTGAIRVSLRAETEPPLSLGATIGDVLHNLRSALDSAAWETCQRAGVPANRERDVYFPIGVDPANWESLAAKQLPGVAPRDLEAFRRLQPWFRDEEARALGLNVVPTADDHPLARLNQMAKLDRHRVPHPVLARAGDTWLSGPEGVSVRLVHGPLRGARPGDVVLEWRVDPPGAIADFHPAGDAILALSDEAAQHRRSALRELQAMQGAVIEATRCLEVDVLGVVTATDLDGLAQLREAMHAAESRLRSLQDSTHVIDSDYMERFGRVKAADEDARTAYFDRWRELFD